MLYVCNSFGVIASYCNIELFAFVAVKFELDAKSMLIKVLLLASHNRFMGSI